MLRMPEGAQRLIAVATICLAVTGCTGGSSGGQQADQPPLASGPGKGFARSVKCKRCHVDIHRYWSLSTHATSFRNRNFQVALRQYADRSTAAAGQPKDSVCIDCHAPMMVYGRDPGDPDHRFADEGVGCDFCHSVTAVHLEGTDRPYVVDPGPRQRGPVKGASSAKHPVEYLPLFEESRFCAGCHEYVTPSGLEIISTFSEWEKFSAKGLGETCQTCHMPTDSGSIVDPQIQRTTRPVNTHKMPGSHSRAQLRKALVLRIDELRQKGDQVEAVVTVENNGAGHHIPTGMPSRKLVLAVEAVTPAGKRFTGERVFQKQLVDAKGNPVNSDSAAFIDAVRISTDNRIAAGERRRSTFTFAIGHAEKVNLRATLDYSYSPQPGDLPEERLSIVTVEKSLAAR